MQRGLAFSQWGWSSVVYPYYTVRTVPGQAAPFNTLLSVVNGASRGKVVKVRFREALAGAPVFEVNVFLSTRDVWTLALVPTADGARALSTDTSCTLSAGAVGGSPTPGVDGAFSSAAYANDPLGADPTRVREGYVEVLEMGTIRRDSPLERAVTHIVGKPPCNLPTSDVAVAVDLDPPSGRLWGSLTLVNVLEGTTYEYDAVALDYWRNAPLYSSPGTSRPDLGDARPAMSAVPWNGTLLVSTWGQGVDAVNAVLAAGSTQAEFMRDASVGGATDIVYTMPTRPLVVSTTTARAPFTKPLSADGACESTNDYSVSREEQQYIPDQDQFNRPAFASMCWVTTVQSLNANWPKPSAVLGSLAGLRHFIGELEQFPAPSIYSSGVANQSFVGPSSPLGRSLNPASPTTGVDLGSGIWSQYYHIVYLGLPVLGVSMMRYANGVVPVAGTPTLSNYGAGSTVRTFPEITY